MQMASGLAELVMALFIALFFWISGDSLGKIIHAVLTRITGTYADRLITIIGSVIRGTVYGILGTAIVQGVLTSIGLFISGVPAPVLLGGFAAFVAVFPVGAPLVWLPQRSGWLCIITSAGVCFSPDTVSSSSRAPITSFGPLSSREAHNFPICLPC
nr:AI-2E family transporter [Asaia astilbis]